MIFSLKFVSLKDFTQEAHETDQRASVCFKDVIPFSVPLIQGSEICQNKPDLLIIIPTEPDDNFKIRFAYREEFANRIKFLAAKYDFTLDIVYLMGLNRKYCITVKKYRRRCQLDKDILVGIFIDTYYNQTLKSITILKWFVENFRSAKLSLKLDEQMDSKESFRIDDFYILIRNAKEGRNLITGSFNEVKRTISPEFVPRISAPYLYPGLPQNLHQNYLLSRYSAESLLKAYTDSIYISVWKEDLYITGILATIAKQKIKHNKYFLTECDAKVCIFCGCQISKVVVTGENTPKYAHLASLTSNKTRSTDFHNETDLMLKKDAEIIPISISSDSTSITNGPTTEETTSINSEYEVSTNENIDSSTRNTDLSQDITSAHPNFEDSTREPTSAENLTEDFSSHILSTTTEFSEIISVTDIGTLQINEYESGFENQVYLPSDELESETTTENLTNDSSREIIFIENVNINATFNSFVGEFHNTLIFQTNRETREQSIDNLTTMNGTYATENYSESNTELESNSTTLIL